MSEYFYAPLGPPEKQPRTSSFIIKSTKAGRAKVDPQLGQRPTKLMNVEKLEEFGVKSIEDANVPVKAGDVLIAAQPFVYVLSTSCRGNRCDHCLSRFDRNNAFRCECQFAYFCSQSCRDDDPVHFHECKLFQRSGKGPTSDIARYILRAIIKIQLGGLSEADLVPGSKEPRRFCHLVDHFDDISQRSGYRKELVEQCYSEILDYLGEEATPEPDYFLTIYGRIAVNSFSIIDWESQDSIASGLYLGPSVFDHSCEPNAAVTFMPDKTIVVRALKDMQIRNFAQFFITYIDIMDHRAHRQEHLLKNYYFLCQCPRCLDKESEMDMFTVQCKQCQAPQVFIENEKIESAKCGKCSQEHSRSDLDNYFEIAEIVRDKLNETVVPMDVASFCLTQMERAGFGPFHIYKIQATVSAFDGCIWTFENQSRNNLDLIRRARDFGLYLASAYTKFKRDNLWACQGLLLYKIAQVEKKLGMTKESIGHALEAAEILKICHDRNVTEEFEKV